MELQWFRAISEGSAMDISGSDRQSVTRQLHALEIPDSSTFVAVEETGLDYL